MTVGRWVAGISALALAVGAPGCAGTQVEGALVYSADVAFVEPPAPHELVAEVRDGYVYVLGRWSWDGGAWRWLDGYWVPERAGFVYVQGYWVSAGSRWRWVEPRWEPRRRGLVYRPGYYDFRGGRAYWVPGRWERPSADHDRSRRGRVDGRDRDGRPPRRDDDRRRDRRRTRDPRRH